MARIKTKISPRMVLHVGHVPILRYLRWHRPWIVVYGCISVIIFQVEPDVTSQVSHRKWLEPEMTSTEVTWHDVTYDVTEDVIGRTLPAFFGFSGIVGYVRGCLRFLWCYLYEDESPCTRSRVLRMRERKGAIFPAFFDFSGIIGLFSWMFEISLVLWV